MKIMLVDDFPPAAELLAQECLRASDVTIAGVFNDPLQALAFAEINSVDVAFLDIDMPQISGLELTARIRRFHPKVIIIFVTAHSESTVDAVRLKADGIVFKPYSSEDIAEALERARLLLPRMKKKVFIQTFNRFDVFIDGKLAIFPRAKAKELLALCVAQNGGSVTAENAIDLLWEDYVGSVSECANYRSTVKALQDFLKQNEIEEIFGRRTKLCYINPDRVDCDLFDFLKGKPAAIAKFQGAFMSEYSWAENYIYRLQSLYETHLSKG